MHLCWSLPSLFPAHVLLSALWTLSADFPLFFQDFVQFCSLRPHRGDSRLFSSLLPKYPEPTGVWEVYRVMVSLRVVLPPQDLELLKAAGCLALFRVLCILFSIVSLGSCKRNSLRCLFSSWLRSSRERQDNRRSECVQEDEHWVP